MSEGLDAILARFPDNNRGLIDADDLRYLATALWEKTSIGGEVTQLGEAVQIPPGWTVTRDEVGVYTVTHGLGMENYAVSVTPLVKAADAYVASLYETTATSFTYRTHSANSGSLHDTYTMFTVAVNP